MAVPSSPCAFGCEPSPHETGSRRLEDWLSWQEALHEEPIALGLERVREVAARMDLLELPFPVVTVAGTNGKGTTVALLESMLTWAGHRPGVYASPYVMRFNECVRVGSEPAGDDVLVDAFIAVERARGCTALTAFEYQTLAAVELMRRCGVDIALLEVGLGGARDAVNVFDSRVAVLTTLAIDHTQWLGRDRDAIAREKSGIFRPGRPVVCGDPAPPDTVYAAARALDAPLSVQGREFHYRGRQEGWCWSHPVVCLTGLPAPRVTGRCQYQNASTALMVLHELADRFSVPERAIHRGLRSASLPARQEIRPGPVERIVDVAHNVEAATALADTVGARTCRGRTLAVFAMLADKDSRGSAAALGDLVDAWFVGGIAGDRGTSAERLARTAGLNRARRPVELFEDLESAYRRAVACATAGDRVVVFGSFHAARAALALDEELARDR